MSALGLQNFEFPLRIQPTVEAPGKQQAGALCRLSWGSPSVRLSACLSQTLFVVVDSDDVLSSNIKMEPRKSL